MKFRRSLRTLNWVQNGKLWNFYSKRTFKCRGGKNPATKADDLCSILGATWYERTDSHDLHSDFHKHTCAQWHCMCIHTQTYNKYYDNNKNSKNSSRILKLISTLLITQP